MIKRYRVVTHPDGTQCTRGTTRERVYAWAVVRVLPEGATYAPTEGLRAPGELVPLARYEVVSWRSDRESAERYAATKTGRYAGNDAAYTVVPTDEVTA
jgi:hypothetical protein